MLRRFHNSQFPVDEVSRAKQTSSAAVCVMAGRSCPSLDRLLGSLQESVELGLVDEILVVGSSRARGGAEIAAGLGVRWVDEETLLGELGPVRGKGDAMWRALSVIES